MSATSLFERTFGTNPTHCADAPGRVNLIGEHTDYNGGYAMPIAISQRTSVAMRVSGRAELRAVSEQVDEGSVQLFGDSAEKGDFVSYVQGAYWALQDAGYPVLPVDLAVTSDVPIGSGLSSSAALIVATMRAFRETFGLELSDLQIAKLAHRAESEFVGVPVGTLDQMACSLGSEDNALLLDTRTLEFERVPLPVNTELVVVDSSVRHSHVSGGYRTRRAECERAAALLGVEWLCDLREPLADFMAGPGWQRLEHSLQRRVHHVLSENLRVFEAARAMRNNDPVTLGQCLNASHQSLRDFFEVSTPEVDTLVDALRSVDGCFGARMTGGGFGGAAIALARKGSGETVARRAAQRYASLIPNFTPKVISPKPRETLL
jgi:galactokinase